MLQSFLQYNKHQKLFTKSDAVLLAVSGGVDSVVMCELFHQAKIKFAIAHCNFKLRGKESDADEKFVEQLAEKYNVFFHSSTFDTNALAKKNKLSIQVAARELRYNWFDKIQKQYKFDYVATAHHQDDVVETFFINLLRGTGIKGLHGILAKNKNVIRPLLFANKETILSFAKKHKLKYREDSSNESDKYTRNKIRHHLIPLLKEINENASENILKTISNIHSVEIVYKKELAAASKKIISTNGKTTKISVKKLKHLQPIEPYLYEYLYPLGFNSSTVDDIVTALDLESGKQFFSKTHRIIKDREYLIVEPIVHVQEEEIIIKETDKNIIAETIKLNFKIQKRDTSFKINKEENVGQFDFDKLVFPLQLRKWKKGDVFQPIGMKGKKKLSDFFIDKKLSLQEKENTLVLVSKKSIVWVLGYRADDRFKVTNNTQKIYFAELSK